MENRAWYNGRVTKLNKPVVRETRNSYSVLYIKARPVVVALDVGDVITFREKGRRMKFSVPVDSIFRQAVRAHAARVTAEKRARRKPDRRN